MKKLVLALSALGVLALGFSLSHLLLPSGAREAKAPPAEPVPHVPAPPAPAPEAKLDPEPAERAQKIATLAPVPAPDPDPVQRAVLTGPPTVGRQADDVETRVVHGRVTPQAGVEHDPTLTVLAVNEPLKGYGIFGPGGIQSDLLKVSQGGDDWRLLAASGVGPDGAFTLRLPADTEEAWILVSGRYLYLKEAQALDLESEEPVVMNPNVGAWVTGEVSIPETLVDPAAAFASMEVELEYDSTRFNLFDLGSDQTFSRGAILDADGRFEIRGVDAAPPYRLVVASDRLANQVVGDLTLDAGRDEHLSVTLDRGGSLAGRVVDQQGAPVADAEVVASSIALFGLPTNEVAEAKTGPDGLFELAHVPQGEIQVRARAQGYLDSSSTRIDVVSGRHRDGILLELDQGAQVAGRVVFADGTPAAEVEVNLSFDPAAMVGMAAFGAAHGAEGKATTDAEGHFRIGGLGRGPFLVRAEVDDQAARLDGVEPGDEKLLLTLRPQPGIHGVVLDPEGRPVPAFRLTLENDDLPFWMGGDTIVQSVEDEGGAFSLTGLHSGAWLLSVSAEGWADSNAIAVALPRPDGEGPVEIVLAPEARAAGRVVDPSGQPIAGATVRPELNMMQALATASGKYDGNEARTAEDGTFVLGGLSEGTVSLVAHHPEFVESEALPVEVVAGETAEGLDLGLRYGGTLVGEVFDDAGEPAGGVMVFLQNTKNFMPVMFRTDPDGTFRRDSIQPGTWTVSAMLGDPDASALLGGGEPDMGSFLSGMKTDSAKIVEAQETRVVLGAPPTDPVRLAGRVLHAGEGVAGAIVVVFPEGVGGLGGMRFLTTDGEGRFEAVLDGPGNYLFQVQVQKDATAMEQDVLEFPKVVPEAEEHRVQLDLPSGRITGRVLGADGEPAQRARISLASEGGVTFGTFFGGRYSELTTGEDGTFDLAYLPPGVYTISAGGDVAGGVFGGHAAEGRSVRDGIAVEAGQWVQGVDFRLERPGELTGQVVDVTGSPVPGAAIFVRDGQGRLLERFSMISSDATGRFRYSGVAPGRYTVSARTDALASFESEAVEVTSERESETAIRVDAGTILRVSVVSKTGEAVKATISVRDPSGNEVNGMISFSEMMNTAGFLYSTEEQRVGPLPPGRYTVTAVADGGRAVAKPVTLSGQAERKLKIRLK